MCNTSPMLGLFCQGQNIHTLLGCMPDVNHEIDAIIPDVDND